MYYESLIKYLSEFFAENEITKNEDGTFCAKGKTIKINYNEANKCYELNIAEDGGEFSLVSSYLFDESQREKDIESVAIDFADTLRKNLKIAKKRVAANVELPSSQGGDKATLSTLTQKLLAIFPHNKDEYKCHVAAHNRFLATQFYRDFLIPDIKTLLASGNKKQIKKFYDAMVEIFIHSDDETAAFSVACVSAAIYNDIELKATAKELTTECTTYYSNIEHFSSKLKSSKKLRETLVK